jgi:hypothetical protein
MPTQVDHIDKLLANWMLRLPPSKYDAYCNGELDEMMFQAIMMWHAMSILLHQPHSQLDPSSTHYIKACAPNTPAMSSDAFNTHTKRTIRAARELSKMATYRLPLLTHTHFFAYMLTLSSTIHLSKWSLAFVAQDDEDLRQNMSQSIGALVKYAEMWPMAKHLGCQVRQIARDVYMMKKREQQQRPLFKFNYKSFYINLSRSRAVVNKVMALYFEQFERIPPILYRFNINLYC